MQTTKEFYEEQVANQSIDALVGMDIDMNVILDDVVESLPDDVQTLFRQALEKRCAVALYEIQNRWCSDPRYFDQEVKELFS